LVLTTLFMAATSSGSAEFIAMSSLFTYDVYKVKCILWFKAFEWSKHQWFFNLCVPHEQAYLRPRASGKELLYVSRIAVVVIGISTGAISCLIFRVCNQPLFVDHFLCIEELC
jgi:hypothetical protein